MTLDQYARQLAARFGAPVWLVGSALTDPGGARDVDLRVVISDRQFTARYGDLRKWGDGETRQALIDDSAHFAADAVDKLGLNVDLQIWPHSRAAAAFPEERRRVLALPRAHNAGPLLHAFAVAEVGKPLAWGETDCASLVRRGHLVYFGTDLYEGLPSWTTLTGARRALAATGGVESVLLKRGARAVPLAFAQAGDVVVGGGDDDEGLPFAGLVTGGKVLTATVALGVLWHEVAACPDGARLLRWHHGP